jgi:hypothetical protein
MKTHFGHQMKAIFAVFLLLLAIGCLEASGQLDQTARIEFVVGSNSDEDFDVISLGVEGLLVSKQKEEMSGKKKWSFSRYNNQLKQLWENQHQLDYDLKPMLSYHNRDFLYWLLQESDTEKFQIFRLDLSDGETDIFKGTWHTPATITHFKVLGGVAFMGGYWHEKPVVMTFSFFDKKIKVLPYLFTNQTEINNIEIDEQRNQVNVVLYTFKKRDCQFQIKTYSYEGLLLRSTSISTENDNALISGKILPLDNQHSILIGNYAQGCTQYSQGLYFTRLLDNGDPEKLQWIDFSKLENFFNYLKPRRKQKVVEKINKQKEEGREPKFRYRLLVHDIVKTANEWVLVAEVYYPIYKTSTTPLPGWTKNRERNKESQGDGYRYTHAIVCGFDPNNGNLLWDNCFAIKDVESDDLLEKVQITQQKDKLILGYPYDGKIHTEVIEKNKVVRETESFDIKTESETEKITNNTDEQLTTWYDNFFLAYGYQKINPEKFGTTREVFFIAKLKYDIAVPK